MGPVTRYLGPWVPEPQLWQDPVPPVDHWLVDRGGPHRAEGVAARLRAVGAPSWSATAWASASSFRATDKRGGANGARIRLAPQKDWAVNEPAELASVLQTLERVRSDFNDGQSGGKRISLADLIVLGGCAAVEKAARDAGHAVTVPFTPGRTDATQEQTDVEAFAVLEPEADGFRNYIDPEEKLPAEHKFLDRANLLGLTAPEMTVLTGGMRALDANTGGSRHGVFTDRPGVAHERLLREPARPARGVEDVGRRGERLRGPGPRHRRGAVDRHRGRPRLRRARPVARARRGLRQHRRPGAVRPRLRGRLDEGHERRPVRPGLIDR